MRGKKIASLVIFSFVFLFLQAGFGQTEEVTGELKKDEQEKSIVDDTKKELDEKKPEPKKETIKKEPSSTKKVVDTEKSAPDKETGKREIKEGGKAVRDGAIDRGLLEIVEGDFKYRRIPEIKISEKVVAVEEKREIKEIEEKESKDTRDEPEKKGLFGLSRSTTDLVAKGILILIIVIIFILYRARSKDKRSKVLRRFPKV